MDPEGFQRILRPIRVRNSPVVPTHTTNTFQLLEVEVQREGDVSVRLDNLVEVENESNASVLWSVLSTLNVQSPWIICGDFNCVIVVNERIGAPVRHMEIVDINNYMHGCGMEDVKCVGNLYTWNNKQQGADRVFSKLNRILANAAWQDCYPSAEAWVNGGRKPFKYFTMWKSSRSFNAIVTDAWNTHINGSKMFCVVTKLTKVKFSLKELNKNGFSDIWNYRPSMIIGLNTRYILNFLSQKAKLAWIKAGDENTALFHQSIRSRQVQNQIYSIHDMRGDWKDQSADVSEVFLNYYKMLLGSVHEDKTPIITQVVHTGPVCQDYHKTILIARYTAEEVKAALFSIPGIRAPSPDGFGSFFYKNACHVARSEVIEAVLNVLRNGKLLKEVNHTVVTLIPKTKCPKNVSDFRPISCCNTIYKCITKVLCGRLRQILPDLILENQGGCVHGRYIVHNIMVVQDLVRHYGRKGVKPSCLMKIDLQKAYDTVDWSFLKEMMVALDFPKQFVDLVMECVTTLMFSLIINGSMHGFFKSQRGLRQGEFPSIYLILQTFKLFFDFSGLKANIKKSSIFCHGMVESEVQRVVETSGFTRSSLPFKYLSVPICSKRISTAQCGVWIFVLPKSVLQIIFKICRAFLWSGQAFSHRPCNISWDNICCDKKSGCLGFRDVSLWNVANLGKYVWALVTKQDNVWIKWVTSVYLKNGDWWEYQPSNSASWYWKQICNTKERLKSVYTKAELEAMSHYSVKQVYQKLTSDRPKVHWDKLVWNRLSTPKHRFIACSASCLICGQGDETRHHLFFDCSYSRQCLAEMKTWLDIRNVTTCLHLLYKIIIHGRNSKFRKQVYLAAIVAIMYLIWKCMNSVYWDCCIPTVKSTIGALK
ncbi:uncharacterized protein [Spinacia oleracea]|uniref:Reverse transcriptase domain-containing protein n=1 Tax=Spinacia oleracea TaxID=3562 RepID=A0ABM3RQN7_SPIOL|nr:uncharacterized protein LOC110796651 [Spinacia oleracea]